MTIVVGKMDMNVPEPRVIVLVGTSSHCTCRLNVDRKYVGLVKLGNWGFQLVL
jgi:hypothetical protein